MAIHQRAERSARVNPWAVLGVHMLGSFMSLLDLTIVNIAIPSILADLHASLDQILWVLGAYSLLFAVLLITAGRLGDIFGPRNLFALGLLIFTLGSAGSGLAPDATWLIVARAVQGLGAALMAPQGLPFITSLFPAARRGGPFAALGMLSGVAVLAGPTLGGFIVTHVGWRWIFDLNVPIGVITLALALLVIPDLRPGRRHRLDLAGVLLVTAGLVGVVFGLIEGQRYDWGTVWGPLTIPEISGSFVASFKTAATSGLEVGRGQTGGSMHVLSGLPAQVVAHLQHLAAAVFAHGYVDAMRPTLIVPIALVLLAAVGAVAVRRRTGTRAGQAISEPAQEPISAA